MGNQTKASKRAGDDLAEPEPKKPRRSQRKVAGSVNGATSKTRSTSTMGISDIPSNHEVIDLDDDVVVRKVFKADKCFPRFDTGDVYIKLGEKRKYAYQLHGSVLSRASYWFERTLGERPAEFDDIMANMTPSMLKVSARYEMRYNADFSMGYLVRTPLTGLKSQEVAIPVPVPTSTSVSVPSTNIISNRNPSLTPSTTKSRTNSWQFDGAASDGGYEDPGIILESEAKEIIKANSTEASADSEPDPSEKVTSTESAVKEGDAKDPKLKDIAAASVSQNGLHTPTNEIAPKKNDSKDEELKQEDIKDEDVSNTKLESIATASKPHNGLNTTKNETTLKNNDVKEHDGKANKELKIIAAAFEPQNVLSTTTTETILRINDVEENNGEEILEMEDVKDGDVIDAEPKFTATVSELQPHPKSAPAELVVKDDNAKETKIKEVASVFEPQAPARILLVEPAVNGDDVKEAEPKCNASIFEQQVHGSSIPVELAMKEGDAKRAEPEESTSVSEPQPRVRVPSLEPDANTERFKEIEFKGISSVLKRQVHDSSTPVELAMEERNVKEAERQEIATTPQQPTQVNEGPESPVAEVGEIIEKELIEVSKAVQPTQDASLELMQLDEKEETQIEQVERLELAADPELMDLKPLEPIEDVIRAEMAARFRDEQNSHANKQSEVAEHTEPAATTMGKTAPKEDVNSNPTTITLPTKPTGPSERLLEAYDNLFRIFYCKDPIIDANDIQVALEQVELLVKIAGIYESLHAVRPYVNNCLYSFGRKLFQVIARDPPRWLKLSVLISSPTIFRECIIHIVGAHPNWPSTSTLREELDTTTVMLIEKKIDELRTLKHSIDRTLFLSSIVVDGKEVYLDRDNESTRNTWFVVQVWRDWYTRSISEAIHGKDPKDCALAKMHRTIARGGDAYLPFTFVLEVLEAFRCLKQSTGEVDVQEIEDDLKTLKEFAQQTVKPLCVNNSMLDVDAAGIDYFTCTQVENHEMPQLEVLGSSVA
ncbi:hypothetical protein EG329_004340 [Mollisiaceae sp. DMI_Dod_QoI]|nr:hypothetical protein EG329_004340 [Helotiales sp. DMI_Dod_QoI]